MRLPRSMEVKRGERERMEAGEVERSARDKSTEENSAALSCLPLSSFSSLLFALFFLQAPKAQTEAETRAGDPAGF